MGVAPTYKKIHMCEVKHSIQADDDGEQQV